MTPTRLLDRADELSAATLPEPDEGHLYREWALDHGLDPDSDDTADLWIWGPYAEGHPDRWATDKTAVTR